MFGYKSEEELYHDCSAYHRVDDLRIPIIAFNSADDPFCPPHGEHGWKVLKPTIVIYSVHMRKG